MAFSAISMVKLKTVKVKCLVGICDSVARPLMQNFKQFNGQYGCSVCFEKDEVLSGPGNSHVYPYNSKYILRNHQETNNIALDVVRSGVAQKGIKGTSIFSTLADFDVISNFPRGSNAFS